VDVTINTNAQPAPDAEYVLTVEFTQGEGRLWADADHIVAREQIVLPWGQRRIEPHASTARVSVREDQSLIVEGEAFVARFNPSTGQLTSYEVAGEQQLAGPLRLNFWRPPTDNDRGNGMPRRQQVWRTAGDRATATSVEREVRDNTAHLAFDLEVPAEATTARLEYDVFGDGVMEIRVAVKPSGNDLPDLPRIGMQCQLREDLVQWKWYGRGPWENYWDRNTGAPLGIHSGNVNDLWYRYSEPQETANRTDVRWATFTDVDGSGVRFSSADKQELEMGAYPFDQGDLEGPRHYFDIPQREHITVHLAHRQMGVAGEDSWGARPLRKYTLPPDREYAYAFRIEPVR
jgi:beta-galactosidase